MTECGNSNRLSDWKKYMLYLKLYTLETNIFYFILNLKYGRWVDDPTKYWVTKESRTGGPVTSTLSCLILTLTLILES
jgi:hypothetical protein